jgi:transcriptional regulator with XRE-family HTH domain
MKTRTVDSQLLKNAVRNFGEEGLIDFAKAAGVSISWLTKAMAGSYQSAPRRLTREAICNLTGISENKLFPLAATKGKAAS